MPFHSARLNIRRRFLKTTGAIKEPEKMDEIDDYIAASFI